MQARRASSAVKWGKLGSATKMFGGSLSLSKEADRKKKKDAELRRVKAAQAAADQHLLQQKREVDRKIEKLAAPNAAGKSMRQHTIRKRQSVCGV